MTPTKQQIRDYAKELWFHDRLKREGEVSEITPTLEELREEGFLTVAQHELMRNTDDYRVWLEKEQNETRQPKIHEGLLFDWQDLAKKSNILVSGTNNTGKTRLACALASIMLNLGWKVITFDNSGVWKTISNIPYYVKIVKVGYGFPIPIFKHKSVIYDITELLPSQQISVIDFVMLDLWKNRYSDNYQWCMAIFEEFELYGRNTRSVTAQNLARVFHAGRNKQIRSLAVTTDMALIDSSFIRLCQQRYHGRLGIESNCKRRFKQYYGKEWTETATSLELGEFIYLHESKLRHICVPCFHSNRQPKDINLKVEQPQQPKRKGFWATLGDKLL